MEILGFSEPVIRITAFASIFILMAIFELVSPRLERDELKGAMKTKRWITNLSIVVLSSLALRVIFPLAAVGMAFYAAENKIGLFHLLSVDPLIAGILTFIILDFAVWLEHWASHKIPLLWRIHKMHHVDQGLDVTTALRFHPLEIVISMIWKIALILVLGAPALWVLLFEIVLNGTAMFNHANIKLPLAIDRKLRLFLVTPDMHRVHHSVIRRETDSNYGFNFSFWDRLFGVYNDQPKKGHHDVEIGLAEYRKAEGSKLFWSLLFPFLKTRK